MANILINGLKSKTGGGKSIFNNYLKLLRNSYPHDVYYVLAPNAKEYWQYACDSINIVEVKNVYKQNIAFPFTYCYFMQSILKKLHIDVIFNMGDIVIPTIIPQVYLFDWPYAVYPDSRVWKAMDLKSYVERKIKLLVFKKFIDSAAVVIAQTGTMKQRLENLYGLRNVVVIPNAVSLEHLNGGSHVDFGLPEKKFKCLYLTYYYPHKNLEIFIPLAKKIKSENFPFCLIVTIAPTQHKKAAQFLDTIKKNKLDDVILNVGPVPMANVPALYKQSDALLMPTLLESFSGTYVEAMFHGKPIMTSRLDFAIDVCGEAAFYFSPMDADDILETIKTVYNDKTFQEAKREKGHTQLGRMLTWPQVFEKYQNVLEKTMVHT
jgi:glycosyltransferase involved in cell wall biosynthesis